MRNHNNVIRCSRNQTRNLIMKFILDVSCEELKAKANVLKKAGKPYAVKRAIDLDFKRVRADKVKLHKEYRTIVLYRKLDDIHMEIHTNAQHVVVKEYIKNTDVNSYYLGDYQTRKDMALFNITDSDGDIIKQEVNRILTSDDCLLNSDDGLHNNVRLDENSLEVRQCKDESPFDINWLSNTAFIDGCDSVESIMITLKSPLDRFYSNDGLIRNCKRLKKVTLFLDYLELPIGGTGLVKNCPSLEELNIVVMDIDYEVILSELQSWVHSSDLGNIKRILVNFKEEVVLS